MVIGHLEKKSPLKNPRGALGSKKLTTDFFFGKKGLMNFLEKKIAVF